MDTNSIKPVSISALVLVVWLTGAWTAQSAPLQISQEGAAGNPNDGLGMSMEECRKQLDALWAKGERNKFYSAGDKLCYALKHDLRDGRGVQAYVETCLHVLNHADTTSRFPYGADVLVRVKARIGVLLVGGDYLHFLPPSEYKSTRSSVIDAAINLMSALRNEQKRDPLVLPELTADPRKSGLKGEELDKVVKKLREQERLRLAASSSILAHEELPQWLSDMEANFVTFVEQEYRRVPPDKGEIENIIAHAGLPADASARLKLLVPP